jgi:hypothetical protein
MKSKKEILKIIDKLDNLVGKLNFTDQKLKGKNCGIESDDFIRGFNSAVNIFHYNIGIERKLVEHNVTCGYELDIKLNK